jgi:hypothetical protein
MASSMSSQGTGCSVAKLDGTNLGKAVRACWAKRGKQPIGGPHVQFVTANGHKKLGDLEMAEKTIVEKAAEAVGYGIAMAEDVAGSVKTAVGAAVTTVTGVLMKSPEKKALVKKTAQKAPTKKVAAKKTVKKASAKKAGEKVVAKKTFKKSPAKKAAKKVAGKSAPAKKAAKKSEKKTAKKAARPR